MLADGQIDVLIEIGTTVRKYVKYQGMCIEIHVLYELKDLLANRHHLAALPEKRVYRRRIADRNETEIESNM